MDRVERSLYEQCVAEMEWASDEVVALCPWMIGEDVMLVRRVFAAQLALVWGECVDVGCMAGWLLDLAERAQVAGDKRRAWLFEQWYCWACAAMCREEYHWPELPQEVAGLP